MNGCRSRAEAGGSLPLTAIVLPALLLAVTMSLLFGQLLARRYELWQAADLAALAAARQVSEASLWSGRPSLDAAAAYAAAKGSLRDNGLSAAEPGLTVELAIAEGRVIRARKAAPEVTVKLCRAVAVPLAALAGQGGPVQVCAEAKAAVLRPKRPLP